jgi:three-Cys-motif partner protein
MKDSNNRIRTEYDGVLECSEVSRYAEEKYRHIANYTELFATSMKRRWDCRVYLDLYAGAGLSRIKNTQIVLRGSPLLALTVPDPFDLYIFCEEDPKKLDALKLRAERYAPEANIRFVQGNCNSKIDEICSLIPKGSKTNSVLSLCFLDPFNFGIQFETLKRLSVYFMDFLILLATGMDATRNWKVYIDENHAQIDTVLGGNDWRERWKDEVVRVGDFSAFLAREFASTMESIGYLKSEPHQMKAVFNQKNTLVYYLALFSRNKLGQKLWQQSIKYGTDQLDFFND